MPFETLGLEKIYLRQRFCLEPGGPLGGPRSFRERTIGHMGLQWDPRTPRQAILNHIGSTAPLADQVFLSERGRAQRPPGAFWARLSNWRILCAYFKHTISILGYRSASNGPFEDDLVVARLGVSKTIVCIIICLPGGIQKSLRILFLRFNRGFHFYRFLIHCAHSFKEVFFSHT